MRSGSPAHLGKTQKSKTQKTNLTLPQKLSTKNLKTKSTRDHPSCQKEPRLQSLPNIVHPTPTLRSFASFCSNPSNQILLISRKDILTILGFATFVPFCLSRRAVVQKNHPTPSNLRSSAFICGKKNSPPQKTKTFPLPLIPSKLPS